jgi:hypothetical protein
MRVRFCLNKSYRYDSLSDRCIRSLLPLFPALADAPSNFTAAKVVAKQKIFFDQASSLEGELYCG